MLRFISLLTLATLTTLAGAASDVPGPFGILQLPAEYESHRVSARTTVPVQEELDIARMEGEGCLRHFWLTWPSVRRGGKADPGLTLRVYVDGRERPSVEVPVAAFFGIHHATGVARIDAPFIQVTERGGFNSYFPMPFKAGMRMTLQSDTGQRARVWFQADWHQYREGELREANRFHALYRRVNPAEHYGRPYHLGHGIGHGVLVGITLGIRVFDRADAWYHCGGDQMLLDGNTERARVLSGIGGEDFFGTAWGQEVYYNRSIGTPYYDVNREAGESEPHLVFAAWRFFDRDPVAFHESFWWDFGSLENDYSSVIYWYQRGEALPVAALPSYEDRLPEARVPAGKYDLPLPMEAEWQVCGPFECRSREDFERVEFPESGIDLEESRPANFGAYAVAARRGWMEPRRAEWVSGVPTHFNFVDLTPYYRPGTKTNNGMPAEVSAYAATTIRSERRRTARLRLGHDDWLRVWINGELVFDGPGQNGFKTRDIKVRLKEGDNPVLVKSANFDNSNFRAWIFLMDLLR